MASESASSDAGRLPAAHRTGMATGELNGMSESVTARVEPGSFSIANMLMNDSTSIHDTGCCAWRASCSVDDMAPTAANIGVQKEATQEIRHEDREGRAGHMWHLEQLVRRLARCERRPTRQQQPARHAPDEELEDRHRPNAEHLTEQQLEGTQRRHQHLHD